MKNLNFLTQYTFVVDFEELELSPLILAFNCPIELENASADWPASPCSVGQHIKRSLAPRVRRWIMSCWGYSGSFTIDIKRNALIAVAHIKISITPWCYLEGF